MLSPPFELSPERGEKRTGDKLGGKQEKVARNRATFSSAAACLYEKTICPQYKDIL
jgi:hypothetical protein